MNKFSKLLESQKLGRDVINDYFQPIIDDGYTVRIDESHVDSQGRHDGNIKKDFHAYHINIYKKLRDDSMFDEISDFYKNLAETISRVKEHTDYFVKFRSPHGSLGGSSGCITQQANYGSSLRYETTIHINLLISNKF